MPCLVLADGSTIYDSGIIIEYLQDVAGTDRLLPVKGRERYRALLKVVNETIMFSGFCYTQFADTFQETNGLLNADRTPKVPLEQISAATRNVPF